MLLIKKFSHCLMLVCSSLLLIQPASATIGQNIKIQTHFNHISGHPRWLIILRDNESGVTLPYTFDIKKRDNEWIAFSWNYRYRITVSQLTFKKHKPINNFCQLENQQLTGSSMLITVHGDLTAQANTVKCHTMIYKDMPYPLAG